MSYESYLERQARHDLSPYIEPLWVENSARMRSLLIDNEVDPDFVNSTDLRGFTTEPDEVDATYVRWLFANVDHGILDRLADPSFGGLRRWAELMGNNPATAPLRRLTELSPISIRHMHAIFQVARAMSWDLEQFRLVVHWGGGFGNQARLLSIINPRLTQYIVDLPMTAVLQHAFLSNALPSDRAVVFLEDNDPVVGGINLVSPAFCDRVPRGADLFIATHSLNESTVFAQDRVGRELGWFGAEHLLLAWMEDSDQFTSGANANWVGLVAGLVPPLRAVAGHWAR